MELDLHRIVFLLWLLMLTFFATRVILCWLFTAIEMDNIEASEVQDIQYINKTARLFEVSLDHLGLLWSNI